MIRAIAFDLDNTLLDFMTFKKETAKAAAKAMVAAGLKAKPEVVAKQIFEIYEKYGIEYQGTVGKVLWEKYHFTDFNKFEKIQQAGVMAYQKRKFEVLKPYPGVKQTLGKLRKRGLKLCIVTDAPRNKTWQRLAVTGLADEFDVVITKDDTGQLKPSPLPFKALLKRIKLAPSSVLFLGDNPERDIKGARAAGMKTAFAAYGGRRKTKVCADYVIQNIKELPSCLTCTP